MAKYKINPHTGKLDRVDDASKDLNENDIIDKAEELDDGLGNTATALDVKDAVTKKHTQGTDQKLDEGGVNEVTVAELKNSIGTSHTQNTDIQIEDALGSKVTFDNNLDTPQLRFTDKAGFQFGIRKGTDNGDKKVWKLLLGEGAGDVDIYYNVGEGDFGIDNEFHVNDELVVTGGIMADSDESEMYLYNSNIEAHSQGAYIILESDDYVNMPKDVVFQSNLQNTARDVSVTIDELGDAVTKKHDQNTDTKLEDSYGTKLEIIDDTNPILKFTDKNNKYLSLYKGTDDGDKLYWELNIEDNPVPIYFDVDSGEFGIGTSAIVDGSFRATGDITADSDGNEILINSLGIGGYQQGLYIGIESGGNVDMKVDVKFSANLVNSAEDDQVTIDEIIAGIDPDNITQALRYAISERR